MEIWGHRGGKHAGRENHWSAFDAAWQAGAEGIELDVWANAEGEAVVLHDATIQRSHGLNIAIHSLNTAQCIQHDIPLLSEVIERYAHKGRLNIEIKDPMVCASVARLLTGRDSQMWAGAPQYIVSSFLPDILTNMRQRLPLLALGFLTEQFAPTHLAACRAWNVWSIHPWHEACTPSMVNACQQQGLRVIPWTVNQAKQAQTLAQMGVWALITDYPDQAQPWK